MLPQYRYPNVIAVCPICGVPSTFEASEQARPLGFYVIKLPPSSVTAPGRRVIYRLFRCVTCYTGGLGKLSDQGDETRAELQSFYPSVAIPARVPDNTPDDLKKELREAELCASVGAWRGGAALLRSALEKTLRANGYVKSNDSTLTDLRKRIDAANADGIITDARRKKAHDDVRALGNDVLHEDWCPITWQEFEVARHYVQRIIEDFYDHRATVEEILRKKERSNRPDRSGLSGSCDNQF